ncbi:MAG: ATP-binding protein [Sphingobacteriales bacterium]|nr:MAG: ATP-binding protein [Sphingobacteriales bacterium]
MAKKANIIAGAGARPSNAGDQFHELWALQNALNLLSPENQLTALTIEGVASKNADQIAWEGADCVLYYGGKTVETSEKIEIVQAKYSTTEPGKPWTIARLTVSSGKKSNNSPIRKLANAYTDAKKHAKTTSVIITKLVSNQPASQEITDTIHAIMNSNQTISDKTRGNVAKLEKATGLSKMALKSFVHSLDFSMCGSNSRYAIRNAVAAVVTDIADDEQYINNLIVKMRDLVMPGQEQVTISKTAVLGWFGLASESGLFPAPAKFDPLENLIQRQAAANLFNALQTNVTIACLYGKAGCGKTTTLRQLEHLLPEGSVFIAFDCYGAGEYAYSTDRRHLPENAFVQIANELNLKLGTPLMLSRATRNPVTIKRFIQRLYTAAEILQKVKPDALLVIAIDAADNSVTAASNQSPPDICFVNELAKANFGDLPNNVKIVFSTREHRKDSLELPKSTIFVPCPPFEKFETQHYAKLSLNVTDDWVDQFHKLSGGIPRVQRYAIKAGGGDLNKTLNSLRPGKDVPSLLRGIFQEALKKSGNENAYYSVVSTLSALPTPIPIHHLTKISNISKSEVEDFINDVWPSIRLENDEVIIADEDVEDFIRSEGQPHLDTTLNIACDYFSKIYESDTYAAVNYADLLVYANRASEILPIIEKSLTPLAIADPIIQRQIQLRRLRRALSACQQTSNSTESTKVILLSAEASKDENFLANLLRQYPDLAIRFARTSLDRLVLSDPDNSSAQGRVLAHDAARAAYAGDKVHAREQFYFYNEWLRRRAKVPENERYDWSVEDDDVFAIAESIAIVGEPARLVKYIQTKWQPQYALKIALNLAPRLIIRGQKSILNSILDEKLLLPFWDLLLLVPLALSGQEIEKSQLSKSLRSIRSRLIPDIWHFSAADRQSWQVPFLTLLVTAGEMGLSKGVSNKILYSFAKQLVNFKKKGALNGGYFNTDLLDILIRCWLLKSSSSKKTLDVESFIKDLESLIQKEDLTPRKKKGTKAKSKDKLSLDREKAGLIRVVFPLYLSRLELLKKWATTGVFDPSILKGFGSDVYALDRQIDGMGLRRNASSSILALMHINESWSSLYQNAYSIAVPQSNDPFGTRLSHLWKSLIIRNESQSLVINEISSRSKELESLREPASDKVDAAIEFSRISLSFSKDDAQAFFEQAIELSKDIDTESFEQIKIIDHLAKDAPLCEQNNNTIHGLAAANFITDVAERMRNHEHFPWEESVSAITRLSPHVAVTALSSWEDQGLKSLKYNIETFLKRALELKELTSSTIAALIPLTSKPSNDLICLIINDLSKGPVSVFSNTVELLAEDFLRNAPSDANNLIEAIQSSGVKLSGENLEKLRTTFNFIANLPLKSDTIPLSEYGKVPNIDCKGLKFTTPEAVSNLYQNLKSKEKYFDLESYISRLRQEITNLGDRTAFLDAIANADFGSYHVKGRWLGISETLAAWDDTPAISLWRQRKLPDVISRYLVEFITNHYYNIDPLTKILAAVNLDNSAKLKLLMQAIENSKLILRSSELFQLSSVIISLVDDKQSSELLEWYLKRLGSRLTPHGRELSLSDMPKDSTSSLGRLLFNIMTDVDTRLRWEAVHVGRRLASMGENEILKSIFSEYYRTEDLSFRDPTAPFYWHSGRLWSLIMAQRIVYEHPASLLDTKQLFIDIALDDSFPHVVIRNIAKNIVLTLAKTFAESFSKQTLDKIEKINVSNLAKVKKTEHRYRSFGWKDGENRRFSYGHDSLQYRFSSVLRIFDGVDVDKIMSCAEKWLIDEWKTPEKVHHWAEEPRKARFNDRQHTLWSSSKGSMPIIERYGDYIEWHALNCVIGELIESYPLVDSDDDWDDLTHWISRNSIALAPAWISDLRNSKPLEKDLWTDAHMNENRWSKNISQKQILDKVFFCSSPRMINIDASWTSSFPTKEIKVIISSTLVNPSTVSALARALSLDKRTWAYHFPNIDIDIDESNLNKPPFEIIGLLTDLSVDESIDTNDTLRNGISAQLKLLNKDLIQLLNLKRPVLPKKAWYQTTEEALAAQEIIWSDLPEEFDNYSSYRQRQTQSEGKLLQINSDVLSSLLTSKNMDLIVGVYVEHRVENEYGKSYDEPKEKKSSQSFLIFKSNGKLELNGRSIGSWRSYCSKTKN